ncbi:MAG TPA: class I SAM-dependent methyltransferase [Candidatus Krumholzibacteria bacterium]|nr:class I SAM-dependent methyltransferase [Candidatus Krumholzibacteria bacterium]
MKRSSEKRHWDDFWASSPGMEDVYANDDRLVTFLLSQMDVAGKHILEVGAGTGRDSLALARRGAHVVTIDYSDQSLRLIRGVAGTELGIVCGDALSLPFADESFDIVFHQGLLEHFRQPLELLRENNRVLRRGGYLLVDVPQRFHYYTLLKHALMTVNRWFAGWETEFSARELSGLMRAAGFEVTGAYGSNLFPPVWYRGARRVLLKVGVRLPMQPSDAAHRLRLRLRDGVPHAVRMATSMVIGVMGRKV